MSSNSSKNISHKFANLFKKANERRLMTNNISKKFVKELVSLKNATQGLLNLKHRRA